MIILIFKTAFSNFTFTTFTHKSGMSKVVLFLCALPLISVIAYMISRPALFEAGLILTASVLVTSGIIYLGVYKDSFVSKIEQPSKAINGTVSAKPRILYVCDAFWSNRRKNCPSSSWRVT